MTDDHQTISTFFELWKNRKPIAQMLGALTAWLFPPSAQSSSVLIIGSGGVGKSTTAKTLAGKYEWSLELPGKYEESISLEHFHLNDDKDVELVVAPGQIHRRDATWSDLEAALANGRFRGIILIGAYGYHALGGEVSYKEHRLYKGDDNRFLLDFLADRRLEEQRVLERLLPHLRVANRNKLWMINLVTKQDLWWDRHSEVVRHYREGSYGQAISAVTQNLGGARFRSEFVFSSLVIANFKTGRGETLANTVGGYEDELRVASICSLWDTLFALKAWEES